MSYFYPRPQLRRKNWLSLDGQWQLNGKPVLVPFPPEAEASGFEGSHFGRLTYERSFSLPEEWKGSRILLHFGAVDQYASVYVNGMPAGSHTGGYTAFCLDITEQVRWQAGSEAANTLRVEVLDVANEDFPRGKQSVSPKGMWYTEVSGIWQSVWLEPVPEKYIAGIRLMPDLTGIGIGLETPGEGEEFQLRVSAPDAAWPAEDKELARTPWLSFSGKSCRLDMANMTDEEGRPIPLKHWTPDEPWLYGLEIRCGEDYAESYFALRTIELTEEKVPGVLLNGKRTFLHGVLDQGYFPAGIYTPERDGAYAPERYEEDILRMKSLGFNLLRKHLKVEPEYYYYACDRLGMMVMQDMVSSGPYSFFWDTIMPNLSLKRRKEKRLPTDYRKALFIRCMKETIAQLEAHPCIVSWCIFNEGWGQFDSDRLYDLAKKQDPTRLVDSTSGWFAQNRSDFKSEHIYFWDRKMTPSRATWEKGINLVPRPGGGFPARYAGRNIPMLLSECGGFGYAVPDHTSRKHKSTDYGKCRNPQELTERIGKMLDVMVFPAIPQGMCGLVYTQLSDVEGEINGLYTYDREVLKVIPEQMRGYAQRLKAETEAIDEV